MVTWSTKVNVSEEVCLSQGVKGVHSGSDASFFLCGTASLLRACSHFWERSGDGKGSGRRRGGGGDETEKEVREG